MEERGCENGGVRCLVSNHGHEIDALDSVRREEFLILVDNWAMELNAPTPTRLD